MNITGLLFIFVTYAVLKSMVIADIDEDAIVIAAPTLPSFNLNTTGLFEFRDVGGFNALEDATANIGIAIADTGRIILAVIQFIIDIVVYIALFLAFIVVNSFTGIYDDPDTPTNEEAPWYINTIIATPAIVMVGIMGYKLLRSGDETE